MAEEDVKVLESAAPAEVQAEAEKLGWIPPDRFKGDPEKFVDAEIFLEKGREVLPIVKKQNRELRTELEALRVAGQAQAAALTQAQDAIKEMQVRHSVETQKAVERAREEVKRQLEAASEAGDHKGVAELTEQMVQLNAAEAKTEAPPAKTVETPWTPPPELKAWQDENEWFGKDNRKTALLLGICNDLRANGAAEKGRAFWDRAKEEMDAMLAPKQEPRGDKVEAASHGSDGGRTRTRTGYDSLPADAKQACDADAKKFVGPGKKFTDVTAWRKNYAEIYHSMQ